MIVGWAWLLIGPSTRRSEIDHCCFTDAFLMIRARVTSKPEPKPHEGLRSWSMARRPPTVKHRQAFRRRHRRTKSVMRLLDLEHAKTAVLNTLTSSDAQRGYRHAIDEFVDWYCSEPRLAFNRIVVLRYRSHLESRQLAPGTINLRLGAVRRLAYEAADCGLLSAELAAGIRRVRGVKKLGVRLGNWLTAEQGQALWQAPDRHRLAARGVRSQSLKADIYVFAPGPWLGKVFPFLAESITPTRQEVFFFGTPAGDLRFTEEHLPTWMDGGKRQFFGVPGNHWRGFKIADDARGPVIDPSTMEREISQEKLVAARAYMRIRFPALSDAPVLESRVCQYENSSDHNFILDRHPEAKNVWIVGGGSGHGFKRGPVVGEILADAVLEAKAPPIEMEIARLIKKQ